MPKHERSEYMKGVFFAEEQKEIGWVFKGGNYEEQSLTWEWNSSEGCEKPRQTTFAENEFFDGVIDYQKTYGGVEMNKPDTQLWESSYSYDWITWCGWRIRQEEFTDVRQALHKIMRETKGTINPKWINGWFCPACEGTKIVVDHSCLNCYGKGIFDEYMNKPLVKPVKNKVELELDWQDVRKAAEGGNKAFENG